MFTLHQLHNNITNNFIKINLVAYKFKNNVDTRIHFSIKKYFKFRPLFVYYKIIDFTINGNSILKNSW